MTKSEKLGEELRFCDRAIEKSKGYNSEYSALTQINNLIYYWQNTFFSYIFLVFEAYPIMFSRHSLSKLRLAVCTPFCREFQALSLDKKVFESCEEQRRNIENTNSLIYSGTPVSFHNHAFVFIHFFIDMDVKAENIMNILFF
jgi:hypothetical protein